jgi:hypothetical protein
MQVLWTYLPSGKYFKSVSILIATFIVLSLTKVLFIIYINCTLIILHTKYLLIMTPQVEKLAKLIEAIQLEPSIH